MTPPLLWSPCLAPRPVKREPTPAELLEARRERARSLAVRIGEERALDPAEILNQRRRGRLLWDARRRLMLHLWDSGMSIAEVAETLRMHHTSVMHGLRMELGPNAYQAAVLARYSRSRLPAYRGRVAA